MVLYGFKLAGPMSKPDKKLKIAHVAPLFASIPPVKYGGTERVLSWLIDEQVRMGLDVTLFASGDSKTKARLVPVIPRAIWHEDEIRIFDAYHTIELDMVDRRAEEFDVIHCHFNFIHYQSLRRIKTPMVTTLHWRVDIREYQDLYKYFNDAPLIAISNSQKSYIPNANVIDVIYHGLPVERYEFGKKGNGYVAFIGRFSPEKGAHVALEVARRAGIPIKIGARMPVTERDREYYKEKIAPLMDSADVEFLGELDDHKKIELLKNADATLVPTNWPEPFGLVTIESLCCGTPVIVFPAGGTGEIVKDGEVGFAVGSADEMLKAIKKIGQIDRSRCRRYIEENFSAAIMAAKYERAYNKLLGNTKK